MTSDIIETSSVADQLIKILIIDDNPLFHRLIGSHVEMLGYVWQSASNEEEALLAIKEAETNKNPFSVVTVDIKFEVGKGEIQMGKIILRRIKAQYPNIACIVISDLEIAAHEVLDLRDDYGLDYYISKYRFDENVFNRGIKKALKRVSSLGSNRRRREILEETRERWQDVCLIYNRNLAKLEQKRAKKGIDASIDLENQIEECRAELQKAVKKVRQVEEEIKQIKAD